MKKYYVALVLAKIGSTSKLALARMLIDMLDLNELYEPLNYSGTSEELEKLNDADYFDVLEINLKENVEKPDGIDEDDLRNYDVVLALAAAENISDAEQIMELFNIIPEYNHLKESLDLKRFKDIDDIEGFVETYEKQAETSENVHIQPNNHPLKRSVTRIKELNMRWQDEVMWLHNMVYAPEKERWEQNKMVKIGFSHWYTYLSKYAELRRKEIRHENSAEIVNARMKRSHPLAWAWATNWYNQQ